MAASANVLELNRALAEQINREARANPQSPFAGKYVGIANGQVVVVADKLSEVARTLRQTEPDPARTFIVEASRDYGAIEYIWELN
jgi:hypothetical protein